jgi:hypothetical protein
VSNNARLEEEAEDEEDGRDETELERSDGPRGGPVTPLTLEVAALVARAPVAPLVSWSLMRPRQTPVGRKASGDIRRAAPCGRDSSLNCRSSIGMGPGATRMAGSCFFRLGSGVTGEAARTGMDGTGLPADGVDSGEMAGFPTAGATLAVAVMRSAAGMDSAGPMGRSKPGAGFL